MGHNSLRHFHFELDCRELLGGHAELAEEWQPARVRVEAYERRVDGKRADIGVMVLRSLAP